MLLLSLANEILLNVAENLAAEDLRCLALGCRFLANLLTPSLHKLACNERHSVTALYIATANRNSQMIRFLLENGDPIRIMHPGGFYSTEPRIPPNDLECVISFLTEQGPAAVIMNFDQLACTALNRAIINGQRHLVRLLLEKGIPTNYINGGRCVFDLPFYYGDISTIRMLLDHEANPDIPLTCFGTNPPLHLAVRLGCEAIVRLLVEKGANINIQNREGETPLYLAVMDHCDNRGGPPMWKVLLDLKADPIIPASNGSTVLHILEHERPGSRNRYDEAIKGCLLEHGADPAIMNNRGLRAIDLAKMRKRGRGAKIMVY